MGRNVYITIEELYGNNLHANLMCDRSLLLLTRCSDYFDNATVPRYFRISFLLSHDIILNIIQNHFLTKSDRLYLSVDIVPEHVESFPTIT